MKIISFLNSPMGKIANLFAILISLILLILIIVTDKALFLFADIPLIGTTAYANIRRFYENISRNCVRYSVEEEGW